MGLSDVYPRIRKYKDKEDLLKDRVEKLKNRVEELESRIWPKPNMQEGRLRDIRDKFDSKYRLFNDYFHNASPNIERLQSLIGIVKDLTENYQNGSYNTVESEAMSLISELEQKIGECARRVNYEYIPISVRLIIAKDAYQSMRDDFCLTENEGRIDHIVESRSRARTNEAYNYVAMREPIKIEDSLIKKKKSFFGRVKGFLGF